MKKIKSIQQLQAEKSRINEQLDYLENKMYSHWSELKHNLKPVSLVKDTFSSILKTKVGKDFNGEGLLKGTLAFAVSLLVTKLATKAGEKFRNLLTGKKEHTRSYEN